jgi:dienelactone hydrolase
MIRAISAAAVLFMAFCCHAADPVPTKLFAKESQYLSAKISPTGKYLALTAPVKDQTALALIDIEQLKLTSGLTFTSGDHVYDYWWVNPERVAVSVARSFGPLDQLRLTGELYAMNADGSQRAYLYGYRGGQQTGTRRQVVTREYGAAEMIDTLRGQREDVLVSVSHWAGGELAVGEIDLLNVYTGNRVRRAVLPGRSPFDVVADEHGTPRFAYALHEQGNVRLFANSSPEVAWQPVESEPRGLNFPRIHQLDRAGTAVYMTDDVTDGRSCLRRYVLAGGRFEDVHCAADGASGQPFFSLDTGTPIALTREHGRPERIVLDGAHPEAKLLQMLDKSFPGRRVKVTSATEDGNKLVLLVDSDRDPGSFYLFDRQARKARYLLSRRQWIDPTAMQPSEAVQYPTRDGATINAYLTVANGIKARGMPLVIMPHGGPHGVRDYWEWDAWAQFLASRGYAVLQPNYRGSGGYGGAFQRAGFRKWGTLMQDDLTDGVKWVIGQGIADPKRVCIFGASYGGYAALMSATREPDLYRCAAAFAGVYDLGSQREDSDIADSMIGREYLREVLGEDEKLWAEQSPVTHVARLKAPVFIAHGTSDQRVPFSQAKALRRALEKHDKPYEWVEYSGEEHGFYKDENHEDFLNKLADFLDRHIGAKADGSTPKP